MKRMRLNPEIASYIWKLSEDTRVIGLLEISLGRVLQNASSGGMSSMHLIDAQKATHIADWLTGAVRSEEPWLSNTDAEGRPKKLLKFSDVEGILSEADKAMAKLAQKNASVQLVAGEEELYAELEDGFHVVRLLTANALDRESGTMQHCVGGGAYDHKVETDDYFYLSLRDRFGKPRVSMEMDMRMSRGPIMMQIYGKQNTAPSRKFAEVLQPMFRERGIRVGQVGEVVFDPEHEMHDLKAMPDGIVVNGHIHLRDLEGPVLPETLRVEGDFDVTNCRNLSLPRRMSVVGYMTLRDSSIIGRAEQLYVGRELNLHRVQTPPNGISDFLRAAVIGAQEVSSWTEVGDIDFIRLREFENCGISATAMVDARERWQAMRAEETRQAKSLDHEGRGSGPQL